MNEGLMIILVMIISYVFASIISKIYLHLFNNRNKGGKEQMLIDRNILFINFLFYIFSIFFIDVYFKYSGVLLYFFIFGFVSFFLEYFFGWLWLKTTGERLYEYHEKRLLGLTSQFIIPYWSMAGILFFSIWKIFNYNLVIDPVDILLGFIKWGGCTLILVLFIYSLIDFFSKSVYTGNLEFKYRVYIAFVATVLGGTFGTLILENMTVIIPYVFLSTVIAFILEGFLGMSVSRIYSQPLWRYTRLPVFGGATSWLIISIWPGVSMLSLILFSLLIS